ENFEAAGSATTPPTGWTISTLGAGATPGWRFGTALGSSFFSIPAHTRYAATNDDDSDTNSSEDYLTSPAFSTASHSTVVLNYQSRLSGAFGTTGRVLASTDS